MPARAKLPLNLSSVVIVLLRMTQLKSEKLTKERFVAIRRAIFAILLSLEVSVLLMQGAFSVWVLLNQAKKIDMVIQLEAWDSTKAYDRLGLDNEYANVLGVKVPAITVPITPGRNLAVIVETAAMNNRQKKMGLQCGKGLCKPWYGRCSAGG